jgi:hypothetical protein
MQILLTQLWSPYVQLESLPALGEA